jgi:hypothetical protein
MNDFGILCFRKMQDGRGNDDYVRRTNAIASFSMTSRKMLMREIRKLERIIDK